MSRYPPLFYSVEGTVLRAATAVGLSGARVLYCARLSAGLMSLLIIAYGVFLLSRRFAAEVVLLVTLLAVPATAWFLTASVNPNGLEITAAFLLAAAVLSIRVDLAAGVRSVSAILAVPFGTLLLAWSRPLSWVWASLILVMLLVPVGRPEGVTWRRRLPVRTLGATTITATVLVLTSSLGWFIYALQARSAEQATTVWAGTNPIGRVLVLLLHTGTIVSEQVGMFGWMDTPLPTVAVLAWVSIIGMAVAIWATGHSFLVPRWSLGLILGLGYLTALLDEYRGSWGWQGRYLLPVTAAVCVLAVPGLISGLERRTAHRLMVPSMLVVLMSVNVLSVGWFLFRNVYGVKASPNRLPAAPLPVGPPSWAPPFGQELILVLLALTLVCGVTAVWMLRPVPATARQRSAHIDIRAVDPVPAIDASVAS